MSKSKWKVKSVLNINSNIRNKKIKIYNKNFIILNSFIGYIFYIHNGNRFIKIVITQDMVGHSLNKFILTRYNNGFIHTKKKRKKK